MAIKPTIKKTFAGQNGGGNGNNQLFGGAGNLDTTKRTALPNELPTSSPSADATDSNNSVYDKTETNSSSSSNLGWIDQLFGMYQNNNRNQQKQSDDLYGQYSSALKDMLSNYNDAHQQSLRQSQNYSDAIYKAAADQTARYENLYNNIKNFDPLTTDWGKTLLDYYGVESLGAANGALADGAADNAGNIDSYAAANAERQRLSKLNAGISAISGMSNERFANMLSTLQSIGVDTNSLLGLEGQYNLPIAGANATTSLEGALGIMSGLQSIHDSNASRNSEALSGALALYGTDADATSDYYNYLLGLGTTSGSTDGEDVNPLNVPNADDLTSYIISMIEGDNMTDEEIVSTLLQNPEYANYGSYIEYLISQARNKSDTTPWWEK